MEPDLGFAFASESFLFNVNTASWGVNDGFSSWPRLRRPVEVGPHRCPSYILPLLPSLGSLSILLERFRSKILTPSGPRYALGPGRGASCSSCCRRCTGLHSPKLSGTDGLMSRR